MEISCFSVYVVFNLLLIFVKCFNILYLGNNNNVEQK